MVAIDLDKIDSGDMFNRTFRQIEKDDLRIEKQREIKSLESIKKNKLYNESKESDPNRLNYDFDLRKFLYDKGLKISFQEMEREFYLKERMSSIERVNLINVLKIFENKMRKNRKNISYGIMAIGSSTYFGEDYSKLEASLIEDGFDEDSIVIEKVMGEDHEDLTYDDFLKIMYAEDYLVCREPWYPKIVSEEEFEDQQRRSQKEYLFEKRLGDILSMKGEDLDFAISYDGSMGNKLEYAERKKKDSIRVKSSSLDLSQMTKARKSFEMALSDADYEFKEEFSFLSDARYNVLDDGKLYRLKDVLPATAQVHTYRIMMENGRDLHFYFYDHDIDAKIKKDRIDNRPFVVLGRAGGVGEFGLINDLEAAIKNGEETGVFENPLVLKYMKKT